MIILPINSEQKIFSVHQIYGGGSLRLTFDYALQGYGKPESYKVVVPAKGELWYSVEDIKEVLSKVTVKISKRYERQAKRKQTETTSGDVENGHALVKESSNSTQLKTSEPAIPVTITVHNANKEIVPGKVTNEQSFAEGNSLVIEICDIKVTYGILFNPPTVRKLELPRFMLTGLPNYPRVLLRNCEIKDCEFIWYRSVKKNITIGKSAFVWTEKNWEEVHKGFIYVPKVEDVGSVMRIVCIPKSQRLYFYYCDVTQEGKVESSDSQIEDNEITAEKLHADNSEFAKNKAKSQRESGDFYRKSSNGSIAEYSSLDKKQESKTELESESCNSKHLLGNSSHQSMENTNFHDQNHLIDSTEMHVIENKKVTPIPSEENLKEISNQHSSEKLEVSMVDRATEVNGHRISSADESATMEGKRAKPGNLPAAASAGLKTRVGRRGDGEDTDEVVFSGSDSDIDGFMQEFHEAKVETKIQTSENVREGKAVTNFSKYQVKEPQTPFPFERRHLYVKSWNKDPDRFSVITYNILADKFANTKSAIDEYYFYCPPMALNLDYRKQLFMQEITGFNTDIICLQEVDQKTFLYDLQVILPQLGYDGFMKTKKKMTSQGEAIFFKKDKFRLVADHSIEALRALSHEPELEDLLRKVQDSPGTWEVMQNRRCVVQVLALEAMNVLDQPLLLVVNLHLSCGPKIPQVRLIQLAVCLWHLESLCSSTYSDRTTAILLCGDLNDMPLSGIVELLKEGRVSSQHADWFVGGRLKYIKEVDLTHPFHLRSAYHDPAFTNYVAGFRGTLDYIFCSGDKLQVVDTVPLPTEAEVKEFTALPSVKFPSDHVSLVAQLKWKC